LHPLSRPFSSQEPEEKAGFQPIYACFDIPHIGDKFYREHLDPVAGSQLFRPGTNFYFTAQVTY
jgi:hypothetical protein